MNWWKISNIKINEINLKEFILHFILLCTNTFFFFFVLFSHFAILSLRCKIKRFCKYIEKIDWKIHILYKFQIFGFSAMMSFFTPSSSTLSFALTHVLKLLLRRRMHVCKYINIGLKFIAAYVTPTYWSILSNEFVMKWFRVFLLILFCIRSQKTNLNKEIWTKKMCFKNFASSFLCVPFYSVTHFMKPTNICICVNKIRAHTILFQCTLHVNMNAIAPTVRNPANKLNIIIVIFVLVIVNIIKPWSTSYISLFSFLFFFFSFNTPYWFTTANEIDVNNILFCNFIDEMSESVYVVLDLGVEL